MRFYQLKEEGAFNDADYFALIDKEQEALGPSLESREEYELKPGETSTGVEDYTPEAKYLGAVAGFRDIRNAKWKALSPAPEQGLSNYHPNKLKISRETEVQITVAK